MSFFNLIGFSSILVLLFPMMVYIYQSMFSNHSIVHNKAHKVDKNPKRVAKKQQRRQQQQPSVPVKTRAREHRKVVNQQSANLTTKNVSNPYDIYR